jgi:hypothetical protein
MRGEPVRLRDGKYECVHCGAVLEIPAGEGLHVVITAATGKPNVRVLMWNFEEIHRCDVDAD